MCSHRQSVIVESEHDGNGRRATEWPTSVPPLTGRTRTGVICHGTHQCNAPRAHIQASPGYTGFLVVADAGWLLAETEQGPRTWLQQRRLASRAGAAVRIQCLLPSVGRLSGCLNTAGHGGIIKRGETTNAVQTARIARTRWFFENRSAFLTQLAGEIETHIRRARAHGMTPVVRLNGTSDIPWERVNLNGRTMFEMFPEIQFYDYSKIVERALAYANGQMPTNYHVTFSRSESNSQEVARVLAAGGNVAVVFKTAALPTSWHGATVANGDQDGLRFLDPAGCVVGLKAKGKAKKDTSGFVVDPTARISLALPVLNIAA